MWPDLVRFAGDGDTLAFSFPRQSPPAWRQRWQALVGQVTIAPDAGALDALLTAFVDGKGVRTLGFVNAHAFNMSVSNPDFARDLLQLDHIVRDGVGVSALYRLIGHHSGLNLNGTDLLPELMARYAGKRIALFGTQLPMVETVAARLIRELGAEMVTADGFQPDGQYLALVARTRPDLVVLGMGMPKQERVARLMKHGLDQDVAIVCGGAILDFLSGHKPRAPYWMRRAGLEWAFRLSIEPKRLFRRYVIGNPLFLLRSALLALRPRPASARRRALPEHSPVTHAYGIGGPVTAMATAMALAPATERPPQPRQPPVSPPRPAGPKASRPLPAPPPPAPPQTAVSVFSANRPVIARDDLFGRQRDLDRLLAWVLDQSGNALIYGPRGYGKTSLVRVFGEIADSRDHVVIYASCSRHVDFDGLMRSYLGEIPDAVPPEALAAAGPLGVPQVAMLLANAGAASLVLIVDEFDRIERSDTRQNLVELIKDVSDLTASVRFVLVGVATDATAILGYHPSVQRCITCVPLTRLDPAAIAEMFARKAEADRLSVSPAQIETVVRLTAGSAYHAQLIGQKLVSETRRAGRSAVADADLDRVIDDILADAALMDDGFAKMARALRQPQARDVMVQLARMALAGSSDLISFAPDAPPSELRRICVGLTGDKILQHVDPGDGGASFRFTNAFLPQLLLMIEHRAGASSLAGTVTSTVAGA